MSRAAAVSAARRALVLALAMAPLLLLLLLLPAAARATPLDDFLALPDPLYSWSITSSFKGAAAGHAYTVYVMNLVSGSWLTPNDTDSYVWRHWAVVCVPQTVTNDKSFVYIDGGHTNDPEPTEISEITLTPCLSAGSITVHLTQIPNEPIVFTAEGKRRSEDAIIAYTWLHFIQNPSEPFWLLRMPMVRAGVRLLDAVQEFVAKQLPGVTVPTGFAIAGASKRGWVTWLMGAVDKRVFTIVPIVLDVLNMVPNIGHQWQCYGNWSFALDDYLELGLMSYLNDPIFQTMADIIDPFAYRDRLTLPKYMIVATGDEFFLPDSPSFFWSQMSGPKWMFAIPDCEHSIAGHQTEVILSATSYFMRQIKGESLPEFTWGYSESPDNKTVAIYATAPASNAPAFVKLWHAHNPFARDFRLVTNDDPIVINPILWLEALVEGKPSGDSIVYSTSVDVPSWGWRAFLLELEWNYGLHAFGENFMRVTTEVVVAPNTLPYPPCGEHCQ